MSVQAYLAQINISAGGIPKLPVETAAVNALGIQDDKHLYSRHGGPRQALPLVAA